MHSIGWPEPCLSDPVENEPRPFVEATRVRVGRYLDSRHSLRPRGGNGVAYECATDSVLRPVRVDKEVFKLANMLSDHHGREANDSIIDDSHSNPTLGNRKIRERQRALMGQKIRAISFVRERRPPIDVAQDRAVGSHREPDGNVNHGAQIARFRADLVRMGLLFHDGFQCTALQNPNTPAIHANADLAHPERPSGQPLRSVQGHLS